MNAGPPFTDDHEVHDDVRRLRNLTRADAGLRVALAEESRAKRFDLETRDVLRLRIEDAIEALAGLIHDGDFWSRLQDSANRPLDNKQSDAIENLDATTLVLLLKANGYRYPPEPPPEKLVRDTIAAFQSAVATDRHLAPGEAVARARKDLTFLIWRTRRDIRPRHPDDNDSTRIRKTANSVGRAMRWLMIPAIGVGAGGAVEAFLPGTGIGYVAGKAAANAAETLTTRSLEFLSDHVRGNEADIVVPEEVPWTEIDPVLIHFTAAHDLLVAAMDRLRAYDARGGSDARKLITEAGLHLRRLDALRRDWPNLDDRYAPAEFEQLRRDFEWTAEEIARVHGPGP